MGINFTDLEELRQLSPLKFIAAASAHYGMMPDALTAFLTDYDVQPKGGWGPPADEPLDMTMTEIAQRVDLPVKIVGRLQDMSVIHRPINCGDFDFLQMFRKAWGNVFLLRSQLANFSQAQREDLISRPTLASKWERWTYAKFFFNNIGYDSQGRMLNPKDRILIDDLADSIQNLFNVPKCTKTIERLHKIREYANNDRKRIRNGSIKRREVLANRSIPETFFELEIELFGNDVMYS